MARNLTDPNDDGTFEWQERVVDVDGDSISIDLILDEVDDGSGFSNAADSNPSWLSYGTDTNTINTDETEVLVNIDADASGLSAGYKYKFEITADDGLSTTTRTFQLEVTEVSASNVLSGSGTTSRLFNSDFSTESASDSIGTVSDGARNRSREEFYIADSGNNDIIAYDKSLTRLWTTSVAYTPYRIAVDPTTENLVVSEDANPGSIYIYDVADGSEVGNISGLDINQAITVDGSENIYTSGYDGTADAEAMYQKDGTQVWKNSVSRGDDALFYSGSIFVIRNGNDWRKIDPSDGTILESNSPSNEYVGANFRNNMLGIDGNGNLISVGSYYDGSWFYGYAVVDTSNLSVISSIEVGEELYYTIDVMGTDLYLASLANEDWIYYDVSGTEQNRVTKPDASSINTLRAI